jgi:hypothetical protein
LFAEDNEDKKAAIRLGIQDHCVVGKPICMMFGAIRRYDCYIPSEYTVDLGIEINGTPLVLDMMFYGNEARFIKRCSKGETANCELVKRFTKDKKKIYIFVVATKQITKWLILN